MFSRVTSECEAFIKASRKISFKASPLRHRSSVELLQRGRYLDRIVALMLWYLPLSGERRFGSHLILTMMGAQRKYLVTNRAHISHQSDGTRWHDRRHDTRRVETRPAQSRDIVRRPPALVRHAAVSTRADGMGAVAAISARAVDAPVPSSSCHRRRTEGAAAAVAHTYNTDYTNASSHCYQIVPMKGRFVRLISS